MEHCVSEHAEVTALRLAGRRGLARSLLVVPGMAPTHPPRPPTEDATPPELDDADPPRPTTPRGVAERLNGELSVGEALSGEVDHIVPASETAATEHTNAPHNPKAAAKPHA